MVLLPAAAAAAAPSAAPSPSITQSVACPTPQTQPGPISLGSSAVGCYAVASAGEPLAFVEVGHVSR